MTSEMLRLADNQRGGVSCGARPFPAAGGVSDGLVRIDRQALVNGPALVKGLAQIDGLADIVRRAVVPRLCEALAGPRECAVANDSDHVGALADRLLADDVGGACARIDAIRASGRSLERIYLDLLMPAAAHLDRLFAQDLRGCADVTIAFLNLQSVLRRFAMDFRHEAGRADTGSRALLASPPAPSGTAGLQMFGLLFTAEFFRREGWDACTERSLSSVAFREVVETQWFDAVAMFALRDDDLDAIAAGIKLIRRGAPNRDVAVIACGRVFDERPDVMRLIGADHRAPDLLASLQLAKSCIARPSERLLLS